MALLRQYINGVRVHSLSVNASDDDLNALIGLMEGRVEKWETKASGGTKTEMPDELNTVKFRVGKDEGEGKYRSCIFTLHHMNLEKDEQDVRDVVIGKFNASWNSEEKAEYCNLAYRKF